MGRPLCTVYPPQGLSFFTRPKDWPTFFLEDLQNFLEKRQKNDMRPRFQNTYNEKNDKRQNTPMISKKHNKKKNDKKTKCTLIEKRQNNKSYTF